MEMNGYIRGDEASHPRDSGYTPDLTPMETPELGPGESKFTEISTGDMDVEPDGWKITTQTPDETVGYQPAGNNGINGEDYRDNRNKYGSTVQYYGTGEDAELCCWLCTGLHHQCCHSSDPDSVGCCSCDPGCGCCDGDVGCCPGDVTSGCGQCHLCKDCGNCGTCDCLSGACDGCDCGGMDCGGCDCGGCDCSGGCVIL
ncbi:hypothetical protein MAR_034209 [Mya arenaria]|uniref:Uncharacterized protein n=1 Tax=Mya arenaria TaxID=6604 RepID=A0ABY7GCN1_MYAAR|nr:uncharacterized protein LOC128224685 [Mya arenaria]WAR31667.1 hypothetical protein MAR_034209 [Mya arenaria]